MCRPPFAAELSHTSRRTKVRQTVAAVGVFESQHHSSHDTVKFAPATAQRDHRLLGDAEVQQEHANTFNRARHRLSRLSVGSPISAGQCLQHFRCALVREVPAFLRVSQHVPRKTMQLRPLHLSGRGHARHDLVHCKMHGWPVDGNVQCRSCGRSGQIGSSVQQQVNSRCACYCRLPCWCTRDS